MSFKSYREKETPRFINELNEFLRFQSVSTDPGCDSETLACAEWAKTHLAKIGLNSELIKTNGKPLVYGEIDIGAAETILYYGHYDVQPADPIELWETPPFTPMLRNNKLYARGVADNKGQTFYFLKAVEYLIANNLLAYNLKILLEGEEESGSKGLTDTLNTASPQMRSKLAADILMVCDTGMVPSGNPTITMGLRGIASFTMVVSGPTCDQHSGVHGGRIMNPALEAAKLIGSLFNDEGSILVPGFYDSVSPPTKEEETAALSLLKYGDLENLLTNMIGVPLLGGEKSLHHIIRVGFRPTIEINGFHSGYGGPGGKTIIPAKAEVKISIRLAHGQNPSESTNLVIDHLRSMAPDGVKVAFTELSIGGPAIRLDIHSKYALKAKTVLSSLSTLPPVLYWEGASIPIIASLASISGASPLLVGFITQDDNIHAPNESFSLDRIALGFDYVAKMLST